MLGGERERIRRKKRWSSGQVFPEESPNAGLAAGIPSTDHQAMQHQKKWKKPHGRELSGRQLGPGLKLPITSKSEWEVAECR